MKIIVQGEYNILQLVASYVEGVVYKKSQYLLQEEVEDGLLLSNTLTGEVVLLSQKERDLLSGLPSIICEGLRELAEHGYVVPETIQEFRRVSQLRAIFLKKREAQGVISHYNILPTTDCNARCFYCYESGIKHVNMTSETADRLVDFIAAHHGDRAVHLSWFGGEPTLGKARIDQICQRLNQLGITFASDIVSNGYLFNQELISHAKDLWKLTDIQITLDGTEEVYNKTKAFKNIKDNAYNRVLQNIEWLLDKEIRVAIRLNMDEHNAENLNELIDELSDRFKGKKFLSVYVRMLKENAGFSPILHSDDDLHRLRNKYLEIQNKLEMTGWPQIWRFSLPRLRTCTCMADDPNIIQCTPDGIFGKCEDCIYEHTVGDLKEGISDYKEINRWKELAYYEEMYFTSFLFALSKALSNSTDLVL